MNHKKHLFLLLSLLVCMGMAAQTKWYNPMDGDEPFICGRAWNKEIGKTYSRLPERMKGVVPNKVWNLAQNTGGLSVRFISNSRNITVRCILTASSPRYLNMAVLNHSGVDLYAMDPNGTKHWIGSTMNLKKNRDTLEVRFKDITPVVYPKRGMEYELYLPTYNGVKKLEIAVDKGARFDFVPQSKERPIVLYGSSIVQGASPSRPGLSFANIVSRELEYPIINLGFSGSAYIEPAVIDAICEIDARIYILDPLPNSFSMKKDELMNRLTEAVRKIRSKSESPILLVESFPRADSILHRNEYRRYLDADNTLRSVYKLLLEEGVKNLFYMSRNEIKMPEDGTIEGIHPNDLGSRAYADAYKTKIKEILSEDKVNPLFPPVRQFRDVIYKWMERHNQVLERNRTTNPEILMIGNSITHFWGGEPKSHCNGGDEWPKFFGKRRVTNMGFGWDKIENVYWRIFHGELEVCKPKHICLLIGINNLFHEADPEFVAQGIVDLAALIRERQPQAKLHVIKVYPARNREEKVAQLNNALEKKLKQDKYTELVDLTKLLSLKDGSGKIDPACFTPDGVHPNAHGYEMIAKGLKKHLK